MDGARPTSRDRAAHGGPGGPNHRAGTTNMYVIRRSRTRTTRATAEEIERRRRKVETLPNGSSVTRKRTTVNSTELAVLDYFIVCRKLFENVLNMKIDEEGIHTLSKFSTRKGIKSIKPSDHNALILYLKTSWNSNNKK